MGSTSNIIDFFFGNLHHGPGYLGEDNPLHQETAGEDEIMNDEVSKTLKKLTRMLKGLKTDKCLFCHKEFNKGSNPMKKFCSHWCKLEFIYKFELH
jgi:hypothetical protein